MLRWLNSQFWRSLLGAFTAEMCADQFLSPIHPGPGIEDRLMQRGGFLLSYVLDALFSMEELRVIQTLSQKRVPGRAAVTWMLHTAHFFCRVTTIFDYLELPNCMT